MKCRVLTNDQVEPRFNRIAVKNNYGGPACMCHACVLRATGRTSVTLLHHLVRLTD